MLSTPLHLALVVFFGHLKSCSNIATASQIQQMAALTILHYLHRITVPLVLYEKAIISGQAH